MTVSAAPSTAPAVLDALVARLTAILPDVQVVDGQPLRTDPDVIAIAFTGTPGEAAVENTRTREQMAAQPDRESYDITNLASSWSGSTDPKAVRDRAYELVGAVAAELSRDQTLGGLVMRTRLSSDLLGQEQTSKGAVATVTFVIHVDAFTG